MEILEIMILKISSAKLQHISLWPCISVDDENYRSMQIHHVVRAVVLKF